MVFRKIEDENAKYGVRLQNRPLDFIKGIRNETGSTQFNDGFKESLQQDEQALINYQQAILNGQNKTAEFNNTMKAASAEAQSYAQSLKLITNGTTQEFDKNSISNFTTQQKIAEVGNIASDHSLKNSIQLINEYNSGLKTQGNICESTGLSQQDLTKGIADGNKVMGNYLTNLNGSKASMGGYIGSLISAKAATIGLQIASTALNMAITMGVSFAIQGLIKLADELIVTSDEAIKAGEEAQQSISNIEQEYTKKVDLVSDSTERFAQLLKGVNAEGKNVSLSTDDYNEFLDISNQLAEAFPGLTRTYDENGNAIVKLNGDAKTITSTLEQLLQTERQLANQEIVDQMPDVFKGVKEKSKQYNQTIADLKTQKESLDNAIKESESGYFKKYDPIDPALSGGYSIALPTSYTRDEAKAVQNILKKYGVHSGINLVDKDINMSGDEYWDLSFNATGGAIEAFEKNRAAIEEEVSNYFKSIGKTYQEEYNETLKTIENENQKQKQNWSSVISGLLSYLQTDDTFLTLSDEYQNAAQTLINGLDYSNLDFDSWEDLTKYINSNILSIFNTDSDTAEEITAFLDFKTRFNNNEVTVGDFKSEIKNITDYLDKNITDEDVRAQIKVALGIDESASDTLDKQVNDIISDLGKDSDEKFKEWVNSLNSSELEIVKSLRIDTNAADWDLATWKDKVEGELLIEAAVHFPINEIKTNIEDLTTAATESNSATGLSGDSQNNIKSLYSGIKGYDEDKLFEQTANGVKLNNKELNKLYNTEKKVQKEKFDKALEKLKEQYKDLTDQINETDKTDTAHLDELIKKRNEVVNNINSVSNLATEYAGLTSAYQEWQNAKSNGNEGDEYDSIVSGLKETKELYEKGLIGTDDFKEYIELLSGKDLTTSSIDEIVEAYKQLYEVGESGYSPVQFLAEDETGVNNFLQALTKVTDEKGKALASHDTDTDTWTINIDNAKKAADDLGISLEVLYAMFGKLHDYGMEVNIDEGNTKYALVDLEAVGKTAEQAKKELNSLGGDYSVGQINFDSNDIEYLNKNIDTITAKLDQYKNQQDGTINLKAKGAQETLIVLQELINKRNDLERNNTLVMQLDTSQIKGDVGTVLSKVQELYDQIDTYLSQVKVGADTTEAEANITKLIGEINGLGAGDILKTLKLDGVLNVKGNLTEESAVNIKNQIKAIDADANLLVKAGVDQKLVDQFKANDHDVNAKIHYNTVVDTPLAASYYQDKTATITYTIVTKGNKKFAVVPANYEGTAHASGSAYAHGTFGDWRVGFDGVSLGGELGEELLVRNGRWYTIGKDSAEFFKHQRNDIIFNANQTKELFKYGKIGGGRPRGRVFNNGSALSTGTAFGITASGHTPGKKTTPGVPTSNKSNVSNKYYNTKAEEAAEKKSREIIDWIEIKIARMERSVKNINYYVDSIFKSFNTRLPYVKKEITAIQDEIDVQNQAYNRYLFEANKFAKSTGLQSNWTWSIRNGTINYSDYSQENAENLKKYQELYEKALDAKDAIHDLQAEVAELYATYADIKIASYEGKINRAKMKQSLLSTYSERAEIFGYQGSAAYNNYQYNLEKAIRTKLEEERKELRINLRNAVNSGYMSTNSEQFNEMQAQIDDLSEKIAECTNNMYEFEYANRQLKWDRWDYFADTVSKIAEETQWFVDILEDSKLFDDNGALTDNGMATLGLHGIAYNINMEEAATYSREIARLNEEINSSTKNQSDDNLLKRRDDLIAKQREYISAAQEEKQAIKDLVKNGIDAELDALDKLIDKYTEALDSQKDLYDYQKNVKKQTEDIASLQKQLLVYSQNETDEGKLKTQQLKKSLKEAQENLKETEYDRFITEQKKMLEQMYDDYEETLNKKLDDTDALIEEVIESVNENSSDINDTLTALAISLGYTTSDELKSIISSNGDMIKTYNGEKQDAWGQYMDKTNTHYTAVEQAIGDIGIYIKNMWEEYDRYANVGVESAKNNIPVTQTKKASGDRYIDHNQLAWTQERGVGEIIVRPSDNAILTPLKAGDSILNGLATNNLFDFANNPSKFIQEHLSGGVGGAVVPFIGGSQSIENHIDFDVTLPNVQNYEQFMTQMQNDKNFQKLAEAIVAGVILDKGNLNKYQIKF